MLFGITTFGDQKLEDYLDDLWVQMKIEADTVPPYAAQLFDTADTDDYMTTFETTPPLGPFGEWDMQGTVPTQRMENGYTTSMIQHGRASGVELTWMRMKYIKFKEKNSEQTRLLEKAARETQNIVSVLWLMNQLYQSGTKWNSEENKYLFDTAHLTLVPGLTYGNFTTDPLSPSSLRDGVTSLELTPDPQGNVMRCRSAELWIAAVDKMNAIEVVNKGIGYKPFSANYTTNEAVDELNLKLVPCELMPKGAWVLKDVTKRCGLKRRISLAITSKKYTWEPTESMRFECKYVETVGAADWRGVYGSTGEG